MAKLFTEQAAQVLGNGRRLMGRRLGDGVRPQQVEKEGAEFALR
jgi:hypothetical protein